MKKILFIAVAAIFFSCNDDSSSESSLNSSKDIETSDVYSKRLPCPPGTIASYSYDFDYIALHRGSTGCTSGFSFCIAGHWVRDCVPNPIGKLSNYDPIREKVSVVGILSENSDQMTLHFPLEIKSLPTFTAKDFVTFGFDSDYTLDGDTTIKAGEYIPSYTKDEIIVTVKLL